MTWLILPTPLVQLMPMLPKPLMLLPLVMLTATAAYDVADAADENLQGDGNNQMVVTRW